MKKLIAFLFLIAGVGVIYAQPAYTVSPPSFTAEDEIKLTVDVSATPLNNYVNDVWLWTWISEGCPASCDAPSNVNPANEKASKALMTRDATNPNVYYITIVPSAFFNKPPSEFKQIGFLLKGQEWGNGQTTNIYLNVDPLVFTPKVNRIFPAKVTKDDVVTLYLDQSVAPTPALKYELSNFTVTITAFDDDGNETGKIENKATVNAGNGLHYVRILPTHNFGTDNIESIKYQFKSTGSNVQSDEFSFVFFK